MQNGKFPRSGVVTSGGRKVWRCATPSCSPIHCLRSRHCPRNLHQAGPYRKFAVIRERIRRSEQLPVERQVTDPLLPSTSHESSGRIGRSAVARPALSKVISWWTAVNPILYVPMRNVSSGLFPDSEIPLSSPPFPRDTTTSAAYPPVMCS